MQAHPTRIFIVRVAVTGDDLATRFSTERYSTERGAITRFSSKLDQKV